MSTYKLYVGAYTFPTWNQKAVMPPSATPNTPTVMTLDPVKCRRCGSDRTARNGQTKSGKPNYRCLNCLSIFTPSARPYTRKADTMLAAPVPAKSVPTSEEPQAKDNISGQAFNLPPLEPLMIDFIWEKDTGNTYRYTEVDDQGNAMDLAKCQVGKFYLRKDAVDGFAVPKKLTILVEA